MVEPVNGLGHRDLQVVDALPWAEVADEFGFEERVERFGLRIIEPRRIRSGGLKGRVVVDQLGLAVAESCGVVGRPNTASVGPGRSM